MNQPTRVSELSIDELTTLIRTVVKEVIEEQQTPQQLDQSAILDIAPLSVGEWPEGLKLISREEYYGDDER